MGRREVVTYVCDWCEGEQPAKKVGVADDCYPDTWGEVASGSLLCGDCLVARKIALDATRDARKAGVPVGRRQLTADDAHIAVQAILTAMWLYPGYNVETRGPIGCFHKAIEALEPETAAKLRDGASPEDLVDEDEERDPVNGQLVAARAGLAHIRRFEVCRHDKLVSDCTEGCVSAFDSTQAPGPPEERSNG